MAGNGAASPTRVYVVLEQQAFQDEEQPYYVEVHQVQSRNATNALRQAFKELRAKGFQALTATLVVIPESMWRPTIVQATVRESVSVEGE